MTVLLIMLLGGLSLLVAGRLYSGMLARRIGEDPSRPTPAHSKADGRDYVASPTPVVFGHHFAAIAGAGPIVGPIIAIIYGWAPALAWVLFGSLFVGGVHDYLAAHMSVREGGNSVATIARRMLGDGPFLAMVLLLVVMLALVCAMFLNLSAQALTSTVPMSLLRLGEPGLFRLSADNPQNVVIGGIASMSVLCITLAAPLVGYMYIKRNVAVWKCSILAIVICGASIAVGLYHPIPLSANVWKFALSAYVLLAAGVPVWMLLQSRDFINVHILYVGMTALLLVLLAAGATGARLDGYDQTFVLQGAKGGQVTMTHGVPAFNVANGQLVNGPIWPVMFITIACGAVSGFHSLCASGTTSKQLNNERAARRIGYWAMLLEAFVAVCVICVCIVGIDMESYVKTVHGRFSIYQAESNPVLAFAVATGLTADMSINGVLAKMGIAWRVNAVAAGALAGMVLLEGFLVTTLDAAVRLTRYLLEEVWRMVFAGYHATVAAGGKTQPWRAGENVPAGADGIPVEVADMSYQPATRRVGGVVAGALQHYWVNSAIAVVLMLAFALTGGVDALWKIFATANQLLAALVLLLAAVWLLRQRRKIWYALAPGLFMLATTAASLILLLIGYLKKPKESLTLLSADVVILVLTAYLLTMGVRAAITELKQPTEHSR